MNNKHYTFVANWKMYFSYNDALTFIREHKTTLIRLAEESKHTVIVCPGMIELADVFRECSGTSILCGAQDFSHYESGAYTGQTSVKSIQQVGIRHSIIGHSERRLYALESDVVVAEKVLLAIKYDIAPIVCIGENTTDYQSKKTIEVLRKQLNFVINKIKDASCPDIQPYIAYEPIWAIGTGNVPSEEELVSIFEWLHLYIKEHSNLSWRLLYGGSVSEKTISTFTNIKELDGFLIGGASLDVQAFKKIVDYF